MITSKISSGIRGTAPHIPFDATGMEKDAAAWANLLDDWLGPEKDVYTRLLQRSRAEKRRAKILA